MLGGEGVVIGKPQMSQTVVSDLGRRCPEKAPLSRETGAHWRPCWLSACPDPASDADLQWGSNYLILPYRQGRGQTKHNNTPQQHSNNTSQYSTTTLYTTAILYNTPYHHNPQHYSTTTYYSYTVQYSTTTLYNTS